MAAAQPRRNEICTAPGEQGSRRRAVHLCPLVPSRVRRAGPPSFGRPARSGGARRVVPWHGVEGIQAQDEALPYGFLSPDTRGGPALRSHKEDYGRDFNGSWPLGHDPRAHVTTLRASSFPDVMNGSLGRWPTVHSRLGRARNLAWDPFSEPVWGWTQWARSDGCRLEAVGFHAKRWLHW